MPSQELIEAMGKYNQELIASGIMHDRGGGGLQPSPKGARVTFSGKDRIGSHGPFLQHSGTGIRLRDLEVQVVGGSD
jgi:hypothetical protein